MREKVTKAGQLELKRLLELTARVGSNPLLTQASTGNSSAKLNGVLWIKASGKWMADATSGEHLVALPLKDVLECVEEGLDPAGTFSEASIETAMHAVLPHRVVLHAHSVNAIAWAIRRDARSQLQRLLAGIRWQWIPYAASGLPLSQEIQYALSTQPDTDLFLLGNHGYVIGGKDPSEVENLLEEAERRLDIVPRPAAGADYSLLAKVCACPPWNLPKDTGVHALATDADAVTILGGGILYPCQAIFSGAYKRAAFQPVRFSGHRDPQYQRRPFLVIEGCGVVINRSAGRAEVAMLSGLAQVVRRLNASDPVRYLTAAELAGLSPQTVDRYRERASAIVCRI